MRLLIIVMLMTLGSVGHAQWTDKDYKYSWSGVLQGFIDQYRADCEVKVNVKRERSFFDYKTEVKCEKETYMVESENSYQIRDDQLINPLNNLIVGKIVSPTELKIEEEYIALNRRLQLNWISQDLLDFALVRTGSGANLSFKGNLQKSAH